MPRPIPLYPPGIERALSRGLLILAALALLPFLALCAYNHPLGVHEWDWIGGWEGRFAGGSFWAEQAYWYRTTMGRYASTALLALTDVWYTPERFGAFFVLSTLALPAAFFAWVRALRPRDPARLTGAIAGVITAAYLFQLSGVYDSLYRLSSVLTYQVGLVASLAFGALLLGELDAKGGWGRQLALWLLGVVAVGCNEISLMAVNLMVILLWVHYQFSGYVPLRLQAVMLMVGAATLAALLAPGNFGRMDAYAGELSAGAWLLRTLGACVFIWTDWLGDGFMLPLALLTIILVVRDRRAPSPSAASRPGLWLAMLALMLPLGVGLVQWSSKGASLPERVIDLIYAYTLLAWLGFWQAFALRRAVTFRRYRAHPLFLGAVALYCVLKLFFAGLAIDRNRPAAEVTSYWDQVTVTSPIGQAWRTLLSGEAAAYHQVKLRQYAQLRACAADTCRVERPERYPPLLYDPLADRLSTGERGMPRAFGQAGKVAKYGE